MGERSENERAGEERQKMKRKERKLKRRGDLLLQRKKRARRFTADFLGVYVSFLIFRLKNKDFTSLYVKLTDGIGVILSSS